MKLGELSERVGISTTNLSILKTGRPGPSVSARSKPYAGSSTASQVTFWNTCRSMTGISIPVAPMRADLAALVAGGAALALHASVPSTLDAPLLIGPVAIASCRSLAIFLVALTCPTLVLASRLYRKHRRDDAESTSRDRRPGRFTQHTGHFVRSLDHSARCMDRFIRPRDRFARDASRAARCPGHLMRHLSRIMLTCALCASAWTIFAEGAFCYL